MSKIKYIIFSVVIFLNVVTLGGVFFVPERDAIWIIDYPPHMPCNLSHLANVDRTFGWGRVAYDKTTNTCTINGNLIIGCNNGSETVLKVGSAEQPNETLIMKGSIYIHPYFIAGDNKGKYWQMPKRMNALVLGTKENKTINASLKFACTPTKKYTISCGRLPWIEWKIFQYGGGLYVYNSQIAPLNPKPGHEISDGKEGMYLEGSTVLINSKITGVNGLLYRMNQGIKKDYIIENTVFEKVEVPLAGGHQKMSGCQFINCGTAVLDRGSINAELTNCIFKGNIRNWSLTYTDKGVVLIDCEWDQPQKENTIRSRINRRGKKCHPKLYVRHHIVVEVLDSAGNPVKDATVTFKPEQEGCDLLQNRKFKTGADGKTAGRGQKEALVLTKYIKTATDIPDKPKQESFTYTLTAEKKNKKGMAQNIVPDLAWKVITIKIKNGEQNN